MSDTVVEERERRVQQLIADPAAYFAAARAKAEAEARVSVRAHVRAAGRWRRAA